MRGTSVPPQSTEPAGSRLSGIFGRRPGSAGASVAASDEMRHAIELLRDFEDSRQGFFWSTDPSGNLTYLSPAIIERTGRPRDEVLGQRLSSLVRKDSTATSTGDRAERTLPFLLGARNQFADLPVRAALPGDECWWALSGRPYSDEAGTFIGYRGNGVDITESRRDQHAASRLAMYDSLTGLANRHHMAQRLNTTLTAYTAAKRSCAVLLIDLDRFKQVNDTLGHPAGDELLKQVAQRIKGVCDAHSCEIGRLGGDEFQIMLPDLDDRGRLGEIANQIISIVSQPYSIEGSRCVIGASVGIAIAPYDGINSEELIRSADLALYAAKGGGRGQYRFYSGDLHSIAEERRALENDLRDALQRGEISLAYQPVVAAATNQVEGFEALMRWDHPDRGAISPALFIPIAEETGIIGALGEWALRQACADAAEWPETIRVAVNVSPVQFANVGLPAVVSSALASSGLSPDRLELEITEGVFLSESTSTDEMFSALKNVGVRLALDDFGTGYSSLGYLKKAPFDKIKIDQSFIRGVTLPGSRNGAIITAIVSLAEALDMDTTAEGIEALDELDLVRERRVSHIQGFIYSQAMPQQVVLERFAAGELTIEPSGPSRQRPSRRTMFRKIGVIHEDHRYEVTMRNLSETGAMITGLLDVPLDTQFVVDFGEGQLAVARVRRSHGPTQGLEFELPLISDGADGLCTRHRLSPYVMAAAGMPLAALPPGNYTQMGLPDPGRAFSLPRFAQATDQRKRGKAA
ncbi:putative bifunctional diguanylate cyclase/phosphodiesterase [Novosphingobium tardum]|uniref:Bifunctional diguanylate cyclase/phosphodiesterase n=1 Tax=Novosphingobium tardum TaxID=1538021 RepID=A0ABV8RP19_9SPHN